MANLNQILGEVIKQSVADTKAKVSAHGTDTAAHADIRSQISVIVGEDANKSAREIAAAVIAEALIPENAGESLNTVQEIAAWIQQHPEDAAAMNAAISANTSAIAAINNSETGAVKTAKDYTDELNTAMNTRVTALEAAASGEITAEDVAALFAAANSAS